MSYLSCLEFFDKLFNEHIWNKAMYLVVLFLLAKFLGVLGENLCQFKF